MNKNTYIISIIGILLIVIIVIYITKKSYESYSSSNLKQTIPKILWLYWDTGYVNAPKICQLCIESWVHHNPDWDVRVLDETSIYDYLPEDLLDYIFNSGMSKNHQCDMFRTNLMAIHGGVYTDATIMCNRPLDDWIYKYTPNSLQLWFPFDHHREEFGYNFIVCSRNNKIFKECAKKLNDWIYGINDFNELAYTEVISESYDNFSQMCNLDLVRNNQIGETSNRDKKGHKVIANDPKLMMRDLEPIVERVSKEQPFLKLTWKGAGEELLSNKNSNIYFLLSKNIPYKFSFMKNDIPKIIWMYYDKGLENSPDICKKCVDSWKYHNPDWDVRVLDDTTMHQYLPISVTNNLKQKNQIQTQSDIIRINLMKEHGGVWADMSVMCNKPLKDWIDDAVSKSGCFFFQFPSKTVEYKDGMISSWFIACEKNCEMIETFCNSYNSFWNERTKTDDYFNFHSTFRNLYDNRTDFKIKVDSMFYKDNVKCHSLNDLNKCSKEKLSKRIKYDIDNNITPCFKLNSREFINLNKLDKKCILKYLICENTNKDVNELEFIHIPKTAGTSIEDAAKSVGINWGRFNRDNLKHTNSYDCTEWHQPDNKIYKEKNTFCVVRNPYNRIVSEFLYNSGKFGRCKNKTKGQLKQEFKDWLYKNITQYKQNKSLRDCHFLPQTKYIYDNNGNMQCDYIIKLERLYVDIYKLFKEYGIEYIQIPHNNVSKRKCFTIQDLDSSDKKIIYDLYKNDFKRLNYSP